MKGEPRIALKRLPHGGGLPLPAYQSTGAAGLDLLAAVPIDGTMSLEPGCRQLVPTGFSIEIPEGFEAQVRPRSGLAYHHGITVLNAPGTIDSDYRGEILVLLINFGDQAFEIRRGARIAQLVIAQFSRAALVEVLELTDTSRGAAGFGSTGVKASPKGRL